MQQLSDERAPIDVQPQDRLVEILMWLVFKGALPDSWNPSCHGHLEVILRESDVLCLKFLPPCCVGALHSPRVLSWTSPKPSASGFLEVRQLPTKENQQRSPVL